MDLGSLLKILSGASAVVTGLRGLSGPDEAPPASQPEGAKPIPGDPSEKITKDGNLTGKLDNIRTIDAKVKKIIRLVRLGKRSPRIQLAVSKVLNRKCGDKWCIPEKDHKREIVALFNWVRSNVRYMSDPRGLDTFRSPERTLFDFHGGDCFVRGTFVLRDDHELVPVESLRMGDKIWGLDKWSTVTQTWDRGTRATWSVQLNNGSAMRLTPEHKVWVRVDGQVERVRVRDLKPKMEVLQPARIPFGTGDMDPTRAHIEGLYLSDGWACPKKKGGGINDFCISGRDGKPKEAQKKLVAAYCETQGIPTYWHRRYIAVKDREWAERLHTMGDHAPNKHALSLNYDEGAAFNLLEGILADSSKDKSGRTLTTTSRQLFLQARVLAKIAGITCSEKYIVDHGGLGTNPIWRLHLRISHREVGQPKVLRVREVIRDNVELPCVDFETDDHYVWLPEADWTTSQCDDLASALAAVLATSLETAGFECRLRVVAVAPNGPTNYSHILVLVGMPQRGPKNWIALDASVDKPPGWYPADRITGHRDYKIPA